MAITATNPLNTEPVRTRSSFEWKQMAAAVRGWAQEERKRLETRRLRLVAILAKSGITEDDIAGYPDDPSM